MADLLRQAQLPSLERQLLSVRRSVKAAVLEANKAHRALGREKSGKGDEYYNPEQLLLAVVSAGWACCAASFQSAMLLGQLHWQSGTWAHPLPKQAASRVCRDVMRTLYEAADCLLAATQRLVESHKADKAWGGHLTARIARLAAKMQQLATVVNAI
eukprot:PLAT9173.1.p1 GENE.PLAT9173.1~~PLAT9173.1.p1  ORF type:complete len:183 (+),score=54.78 PLAT9173.1:81-551(+)